MNRDRKARGPRILVLGSGWPAETFLESLYRGLADRGAELWIAGRRPFRDLPPGIHRLPLPTDRGGNLGGRVGRLAHGLALGVGAALRRPAAVLRQVRAEGGAITDLPFLARRFDLLYFPWNASAVRHRSLLRAGVPSLVSCRGAHIQVAPANPRRAAMGSALPETFALATAVHCVSRAMVEAARSLGLDPAKATVIRPAVDVQAFRPAGGRHGTTLGNSPRSRWPFHLLTTGSLIWRKGLEYAVRTVHLLRREGLDVELTILGEGPERRRLLFAREELGLAEHVHLPGRVGHRELRRHLDESHAFVLPSLSEGISNAVLEAMACGLPVVSTRVGGMHEAIEDGESGILVPSRQPAAMARAVRRLTEDPELPRRLGESARRRVEQDFDRRRQLDAFFELCRKIAGEAR